MTRTFTSSSDKAGLSPGSLIHVGKVIDEDTRITITNYNNEKFEERQILSADEILQHRGSTDVTWVVIEGLANVDIVERIGEIFDIHQLVLEDILNTHQRPKYEEYDNYLYIVLKSILTEDEQFTISYEQVSILLVDTFVIVFKEKKDDLFDSLTRRIQKSRGHIRNQGADFLTYAILDIIVDQYFNILDSLDEAIIPLEDSLTASELDHHFLVTTQKLKREVINIRRHVSPIRELLGEMLRSDSELINDRIHIYLRDVSDHAIRVIESIESHRDILTGLLEVYMSGVSNKMNEIMKVLTIFASIFIPLTFIAGIYGMNFEHMPELKEKWAYPAIWILFISIPAVLLIYFKRKKWL